MLIPIGFLGAGGAAGSFELISTTLLSTSTASVSFSSIVGTYKHLQIRFTARSVDNGTFPDLKIRLNSDTGTNYSYHRLRGYGSGVDSGSWTSTDHIRWGAASKTSTTTNSFYAGIADILDYASTTKNTTTRFLGGHTADGYDDIRLESGLWINTAAVSSILLFPSSGNFAANSRFSLYGIKG
jgi:hypothetical protein